MRRFLAACCIALNLASIGSVDARVRRLSLDELRAKAEAVVLGTVEQISTRADAHGRMVWTDYEIALEATLEGPDQGTRLVVSFAGGVAGDLDIGIAEMPTLEAGQRYVLFLMPPGDHAAATVGWGQGVYRVLETRVGRVSREVLVSADGESLVLGAAGALERGPVVEVIDGALHQPATGRAAHDPEPPASDPVTTDAYGHPVAQPTPRAPAASGARPQEVAQPRFATIADLQRFLDRDQGPSSDN